LVHDGLLFSPILAVHGRDVAGRRSGLLDGVPGHRRRPGMDRAGDLEHEMADEKQCTEQSVGFAADMREAAPKR
jgi:hypothetical protein